MAEWSLVDGSMIGESMRLDHTAAFESGCAYSRSR